MRKTFDPKDVMIESLRATIFQLEQKFEQNL